MEKERLRQLVSELSLKEKVDQMLQITGDFYLDGDGAVLTGPGREMGLAKEDVALAGSTLGTYGAETLIKIQREYMERHPHRIPLLFMMDVIHGMKTVFPIPLAQGATFEPELSEKCARAAAREAAVSGLHVTFAPMADLVRDARWGRMMEATGEDPYLNGKFTAAMVRGFQGEDPAKPYRIGACVKHFAAYGAAEAGRDYNTVQLCENTLRNYYLPAYEEGIRAGAALVMTSFNTVDNIPASVNQRLMRGILREEMGFDGVLISDFAALLETLAHGAAGDEAEAAQKAISAGVDIDMMTGVYAGQLCGLVEKGRIDERLIDEAVLRILELKNKLGLFENPYKDADPEKEREILLCPEHRALAREAAAASFVLLKNDGALPLDKSQKIAFIGPYTEDRKLKSTWAFIGDSKDCVTIREAAEEVFDPRRTAFCKGSPMLGADVRLEGFTETAAEAYTPQEREAMLREAERRAAEAELVVMPLGEHYLQSGEATSRAMIEVPEVQMELFRRVHAVNPNIVVVLFCGRALDIREISQKARAVLVAWRPGTEGGHAVIDVLTGAAAPSGKLPVSFPYCVGQVPVYYNGFSTGRPCQKGVQDRFRSKYLDIPNEPLYPFGYGLTYTQFEVSPVRMSGARLKPGGELTAAVTLKNTGRRAGTEVVQLYLRDLAASAVRPVRELKSFSKVTLEPGEEREIRFAVREEMLRFWDAQCRYRSEPGRFRVYIGTDSTAENSGEFELTE